MNNKHAERNLRMWDSLYEEFEDRNPYLAEKVKYWYPSGHNEITIKLEDGRYKTFDFFTKTARDLHDPRYNEDLPNEDDYRIDFSSRLINTMRRHGVTREALAERTDISSVMIGKYVNGHSTPSIYTLARLAKGIGCSINELINF